MNPIDFVVTWVDGSDEAWINEKNQYSAEKVDVRDNRFRDWGTMKYWFRAVDKFAPWVHKIYFITWGHVPEWLDLSNEKLVVMNHKDYIPEEYRPTFNSNVIELNLYRIKELSEQFVLFSDDVFLTDFIEEKDFFQKGLPVDFYGEVNDLNKGSDRVFAGIINHNYEILNQYYHKRVHTLKHPYYFFNTRYGINANLHTMKQLFNKNYMGINMPHLAQPYLKSEFQCLWEKEYDACHQTSLHKFRHVDDINHYLVRFMQLCECKFVPCHGALGKTYIIPKDLDCATQAIVDQKHKIICLNDDVEEMDEHMQTLILSSFEQILPEQSSFEK